MTMSHRKLPRPLHLLGAALTATALLLAACGGGGGDGATGSAGTGATTSTLTEGPITGFGSIIVNGVRFDDSAAAVSDDDDAASGRDRLKLGMQVEIESESVSDDGSGRKARAARVRFGSEIVGPVQGAPDVSNGRLTVLGQTVEVSAATVFAQSGGLAALHAGDVLEVHAQYDSASAAYRATRIELRGSVDAFRLRGVVSSLTASTFRIGGATIDYVALSPQLPATALADGQRVRVRLAPTQTASGVWNALAVRSGQRGVDDFAEASLHGTITAFSSATQFSVDGIPVDASSAVFPDGRDALAVGVEVEVEGPVVAGVLMARKVALEDERHGAATREVELHGTTSGYDGQRFVLRGLTVQLTAATVFRGVSPADLARSDLRIELKGELAADGVTLLASRISRED